VFASRRRHTRFSRDWSSDVCSSDLVPTEAAEEVIAHWLAEPRPDGRPVKRGPAADRLEDRLLAVPRRRGVWFAPEPISRYSPHRSGGRRGGGRREPRRRRAGRIANG